MGLPIKHKMIVEAEIANGGQQLDLMDRDYGAASGKSKFIRLVLKFSRKLFLTTIVLTLAQQKKS